MPLEAGSTFAGFRIVKKIGEGGMGEVYLVEHPRLPREEALKVLPENVTSDDEYRQRFGREAELASTLWHPNLISLHDRGEAEGRLWISMDFINGSDMGELMRTGYPGGMPVAEGGDRHLRHRGKGGDRHRRRLGIGLRAPAGHAASRCQARQHLADGSRGGQAAGGTGGFRDCPQA